VVTALWPHQRQVLSDLVIGHWLLLWDPGCGKTLAAVEAGRLVGGRQLWITLAILIPQTVQVIEDQRPGVRVQMLRTGKAIVDARADIVVVSYDLMRTPSIWRQLFKLSWSSCVCDEGHALAHSSTVRTRAFYGARSTSKGALFRRCERVWILTGSVVSNSPDELWPHLSRLFPHTLPGIDTLQQFLGEFCKVEQRPYGLQVVGGKNLLHLHAILRACSSRAGLRDLHDLPPLTVDTIPLEISDKHRREMDATLTPEQRREVDIILTQIDGGSAAAWQRLQAMLLPLASMRRVTALAKAEGCADLVEAELTGGADRIVVFGLHLDALRHVAGRLRTWNCSVITGDTPGPMRTALIDRFHRGVDRVLVAQSKVAGHGLNLQACRRVLLLETSWTPADVEQAIARCMRAGQERPVHASILAVSRSIDARVASILRRKEYLVNEIIRGAA
jgi:SNF2 family DNA or RNA helicase